MERFFNIARPCVAAKHDMLSGTERLPGVSALIRKGLCFAVGRDLDAKAIHVVCC